MSFFQGDIELRPSTKALTYNVIRRKKGEGLIIAAGEATGHHHRVKDSRARLLDVGNGKRQLFVSKNGAEVTHEEHGTITLGPGTYDIIHQREYDPPIVTDTTRTRTISPAQRESYSRPVWD